MSITICCVKWGDKFTADHVNRLYRMCKRNFTHDFEFVCHTDDPTNISSFVTTRPLNLQLDLEKWWWKLQLFDEYGWPEQKKTTNIFFDLDVVIQNNFDHFIDYAVDDKLTMIKAYWKTYALKSHDMNYNSSVMIWKGDLSYLWRKFNKDPERYLMKYNGIDGFLYHECNDYLETIPEGQVYSRLFGVDKDNCFAYGELKDYFYRPDYTVCIFNGWRRDEVDGNYLLDNDGYQGFEQYWEHESLQHNHTKIDRDVWLVLWRAFTENKYDSEDFLPLVQSVFEAKMDSAIWRGLWDISKDKKDIVHFLDSLSLNQYQSKKWLADTLTDHDLNIETVSLFGGWFAHPISSILTSVFPDIKWIENTDIDDNALHFCRNLNNDLSCELITTNKNVLEEGDRDWDTDLVINTSSEHMPPLPVILSKRRFRTLKDDTTRGPTIFAIQSNNMFHVPDHINCVKSEDELAMMCNFTHVYYKGSLDMPNGYRRFMVIGYV